MSLSPSIFFLFLVFSTSARSADYLMYIGTYTNQQSKGIYAYRFDASSGKVTSLGLAAETPSPSFVAIHPNNKFLYAANEVSNFEGRNGSVSAFSVDHASGKLTFLNKVSSHGGGPCYVRVDATGKNVLVANYGTGSVAVLPVKEDGSLGEATATIQHTGSGANAQRQRGPHAHSINPSPDNRFAIVADLGLDEVLVYKFDPAKGSLAPNDPPFTKVHPGAGPRHFAFHPDCKHAYVINEMECTVTAFDYDAKNGVLKEAQVISTLPKDVSVVPGYSTAEVQVHPSGKFLYGSNRGHDTIASFAISSKGTLTPIEHTPTQGKIPRNFGIDPTGSYLFAANQNSNNITVFRIGKNTGKLTPTGDSLDVGSPVCVKFVPAQSK